jgi:hypothetical protein
VGASNHLGTLHLIASVYVHHPPVAWYTFRARGWQGLAMSLHTFRGGRHVGTRLCVQQLCRMGFVCVCPTLCMIAQYDRRPALNSLYVCPHLLLYVSCTELH